MVCVSGSNFVDHDWLLEGYFIYDNASAGYSRSGKHIAQGAVKSRLVLTGQDQRTDKIYAVSARVLENTDGSGCFFYRGIIVRVLDTRDQQVKIVAICERSLKKRFRLSSRQVVSLKREARYQEKGIYSWKELQERAKYINAQHQFIERHRHEKLLVEAYLGEPWINVCRIVADEAGVVSRVVQLADGRFRFLYHISGELDIAFRGKRLGEGSFSKVYSLFPLSVSELAVKIPRDERVVRRKSFEHEYEMLTYLNPNGDLKGIVAVQTMLESGWIIMKKYDGDMRCNFWPLHIYKMLDDLISGLLLIHTKDVVHGDIKLRNILFKMFPNVFGVLEESFFISDFGGARKRDEIIENVMAMLGRRSERELTRRERINFALVMLGSFTVGYCYGVNLDVEKNNRTQNHYHISNCSDISCIVKAAYQSDFDRVFSLLKKRDVYAIGMVILQVCVGQCFFRGNFPLLALDKLKYMCFKQSDYMDSIVRIVEQGTWSFRKTWLDMGMGENLAKEFIIDLEAIERTLYIKRHSKDDIAGVVRRLLCNESEIQIFMEFCDEGLCYASLTQQQKQTLLRMVDANPYNRPDTEELASVFC